MKKFTSRLYFTELLIHKYKLIETTHLSQLLSITTIISFR